MNNNTMPTTIQMSLSKPSNKRTTPTQLLELTYSDTNKYEIGLDEVARGPLFGRLYVSAVVLPKDGSFDGTNVKDSKKFSSKKKIREVAEYIKQHALVWHIHYIENDVIDEINILQSVYNAMHECIRHCMLKLKEIEKNDELILDQPYYENKYMMIVDGDSFKPYCIYNETTQTIEQIPHTTIEKGDSKYMAIAAASIIAKVEHDEYISKLCIQYPELNEKYKLNNNVGYGTKQHLDGIREHGITQWHRKTYGPCKTAQLNYIQG